MFRKEQKSNGAFAQEKFPAYYSAAAILERPVILTEKKDNVGEGA